jgi:hypothetical protein
MGAPGALIVTSNVADDAVVQCREFRRDPATMITPDFFVNSCCYLPPFLNNREGNPMGGASEGRISLSGGVRLESVRKGHWGIAEGTAAPDGENSRRGAEARDWEKFEECRNVRAVSAKTLVSRNILLIV